LSKYQIALALAKREAFKAGSEPYQGALALVELRNAIAHPKELIESDRQQKKLEARLRGMYTLNPKRTYHSDFFPYLCLTPDCAFWAVESAAGLFLEFKQRMPATTYLFPSSRSIEAWLKEVQTLRVKQHEARK